MTRTLAFACDCLRARLCSSEAEPPTDGNHGSGTLFDANCTAHGFTGEEVPHGVVKPTIN